MDTIRTTTNSWFIQIADDLFIETKQKSFSLWNRFWLYQLLGWKVVKKKF